MGKLLRPTIIIVLLLSIGSLTLGILLFNQRELLKGRTQKHAEAAMALSRQLTAEREPFIESIDRRLNLDNLLDYEQMDGELRTLSAIATTRLESLFDTASDLKDTRDELAETLDELARTRQELQDARREIARLEGVVAERERELQIANERIDTLEFEKTSLEEEIDGLNDQLRDLQIAKEDLEAENRSLELRIARLLPQTELGPTDTPEGLGGKVLLVNSDWNFIVIDLGSDDELAPLTRMLVHRDNHLVGRVRATAVEENLAICEIDRDFEKMPIEVGDKVFYPGVN